MAWISGNNLKNDWLIGTAGSDVIKGYGGDDTIKGGGGADHIDGGAGYDTVMYTDSTSGVYVDLWTGRGHYGTAQGDTLVSIESAYGSLHPDWLAGTNGTNHIYGLDGDDWIHGRGGVDIVYGGNGNDTLVGGADLDALDGEWGYDMASYYDSPAGVRAVLWGTGSGGDAEGDWLLNIEALQGSAYDDELIGDQMANTLYGEGGNDKLYAGAGEDWLLSGYGNDELYGREGNDVMYGEAGQDRLEGGSGIDTMIGGLHADTFAWSAISDTGTTMSTSDQVVDFNPAEGDRLDVSGIDANVYAPHDQAFTFIGSAPFSGTPGEINYFHSDGDTYIQLQAGTSMPVMFRLDGIHTPEADWFVL
jgi:Ca2+-binding RTX toxin-like protein